MSHLPAPNLRLIFALLGFAIGSGAASAQTVADLNRGLNELNDVKKKFVDEKQVAQNIAAKKFDILIAGVTRRPNLTGAERLSLSRKWTEEKDRFLKTGELSADSDLAEIGFEYGMLVNLKYKPLSAKYDYLMRLALTLKETKTGDDLLEDKQKFETTQFPGRKEFTKKSNWNGSRYDGKSSTSFHLGIGDLTGDVFRGRAAQNTGVAGHPICEIEGSIDGMLVKINTSKQIQGKARALVFEGVVLGKTMILAIGGISASGGPVNGYAILSKK